MVEVENDRKSDTSEREKIREMIKARKEKGKENKKSSDTESPVTRCPECGREMIKARKEKGKENKKSSDTESPVTRCPECGSQNVEQDYERAELLCSDCGIVIDSNLIDGGPEWRMFDHDQRKKRSRVGAPMTYTIHDKGLSTTIDWKNLDSSGKSISSKNRAQLQRLRKWQRRIHLSNAVERNLAFALSELDRMASALGLPRTVRETAAVVYRKAVDKNLIRGRSIEGVAATALYAACRQCSVPRTLDEIGEVSRVSRKEIGRTYRFVSKELPLKLMPTSPVDYVPRFCSGLGLKGEVQSKAVEILRIASEKELTSGRDPVGVAAAAVYIAAILCGERKIQREVADVSGITEVTIRKRYKELSNELGIEILF